MTSRVCCVAVKSYLEIEAASKNVDMDVLWLHVTSRTLKVVEFREIGRCQSSDSLLLVTATKYALLEHSALVKVCFIIVTLV